MAKLTTHPLSDGLGPAERFLFTMHFENGPDMAAIVDAFLYTLMFGDQIQVWEGGLGQCIDASQCFLFRRKYKESVCFRLGTKLQQGSPACAPFVLGLATNKKNSTTTLHVRLGMTSHPCFLVS
jgi:hypothetical protein